MCTPFGNFGFYLDLHYNQLHELSQDVLNTLWDGFEIRYLNVELKVILKNEYRVVQCVGIITELKKN